MAVLASFLFAIMKYSSKDNFKKSIFYLTVHATVYQDESVKAEDIDCTTHTIKNALWERIQEGLEGENEGGKWRNYILFKRNIF